MYQVGDLVFYGGTGVCEVADIAMRKVPGASGEQPYYTMKPLYQECVIRTPVNGNKVFMRPILTKKEAEELVDSIPTVQAKAYYSRVLGELAEHYANALKTYDSAELVELTMSIYAKKRELEGQRQKFGTVDERFMKRAEELLFGELARRAGHPQGGGAALYRSAAGTPRGGRRGRGGIRGINGAGRRTGPRFSGSERIPAPPTRPSGPAIRSRAGPPPSAFRLKRARG